MSQFLKQSNTVSSKGQWSNGLVEPALEIARRLTPISETKVEAIQEIAGNVKIVGD